MQFGIFSVSDITKDSASGQTPSEAKRIQNAIKIAKRAGGGLPTTISIDSLSLLPQQKEANLVFIFDDGYQSILPAASKW